MRAPDSPSSSPSWPSHPACDPPRVPGWALLRDTASSDADAAFCAGAALTCLDRVVAAAPPFRGAFGLRLALKSAAAAVKRCGRAEDEAALRDAWYLRKAGDAPGPAGQVLEAWRRLAARASSLDEDRLRGVADLFEVRWSTELAVVPDRVEALSRGAMPAPFAAAAILREIVTLRADAELFGLWLADLVLSRCMRWGAAVPLLLVGRDGAAFFRAGDRGHAQVGEDGVRRALRAKGAGEAISLLLDEVRCRALSRH